MQQRQWWGSRCHVLGAASVTGFASVGRARTAVEITPPRVGCCGARRTAVGVWSLAGRQFRRCCHRANRPRPRLPQREDSRWAQPRLGAHFGVSRVHCREWGEETKRRRRRLTALGSSGRLVTANDILTKLRWVRVSERKSTFPC